MRFLIRLLVTAAALWVAIQIVPGIGHSGSAISLLGIALIFGMVNALVRPVLVLLTCPLILLTLGFFLLVINALLFALVAQLSQWLHLGFHVDSFWSAFFGALIVSLLSTIINAAVRTEMEH